MCDLNFNIYVLMSPQSNQLLAIFYDGDTMMFFIQLLSISWANPSCLRSSCPEKDSSSVEQNVRSNPLQSCSKKPLTGFYRDSFCRTGLQDRGIHVVCARMTSEFLSYTKKQGNDLSTAVPQYNFPGLKVGDQWCLCAARWKEAQEAGVAPPVILDATSNKALNTIGLSLLREHRLIGNAN